MNVIHGRFDRRATHRIFSEPVALDLVNDHTALVQRAIQLLEASHWLALGTGDALLVKGIGVAHACLKDLLALSHNAAGLIEESVKVDPYLAVEAAA